MRIELVDITESSPPAPRVVRDTTMKKIKYARSRENSRDGSSFEQLHFRS